MKSAGMKRYAILLLLPLRTLCAGELADVIHETRITGGIIALVNGSDESYADAAASPCAVHGLETGSSRMAPLRASLQAEGQYGRVSVSLFNGKVLPYVDNLVNLLVVEGGDVTSAEAMRVLAPRGTVLRHHDGQWRKQVKPWPEGMGEWNQYLHHADNNAVSTDRVGPPERLKWTGGTRWARSHMSAVTVISTVSAAGRLYTIEDLETVEHVRLPGRYFLIARDAFNGMELWRKPLAGNWTSNGYLKFIATQYQRRVAAIGDKVYCPLGMGAPISVLDGATGKVLKDYPATDGVQEFAWDRGVLYAAVGQAFGMKNSKDAEVRLLAVDASTGKTLWQKQISEDGGYTGGTLAVKNDILAYCTKTAIHCADARTGEDRWQASHAALIPEQKKGNRVWIGHSANNLQPTLVPSDDMLYCSTLYGLGAYSLANGDQVWSVDNSPNYGKSADIFIAAGLIWNGLMEGHDLKTGKVVRTLEQKMQGPMGHDRCYRNRITETYFINSKSGGSDFLRLDGTREFPAPWVRATCGMGAVPANGLLYSSPYSCSCEIGMMLTGFNALYDENRSDGRVLDLSPTPQLIKGPAFGQAVVSDQSSVISGSWPTYRRTNSRSGATPASYGGNLNTVWQTRLSSTPTAPIVVGQRVYVAARDSHQLYALSRATGKVVWTFTADGRIDSPPTYHRGMLIFGTRRGWVYALQADDGALIWRFTDLPEKRLISAHGQVESAWPVNGSVTVYEDVAYFAAGRQSFLDGGIVLYGLDPLTGEALHRRRMHGPQDEQGFHIYAKGTFRSKGFKADIFSAGNGMLFLRHQAFKPDLTPVAPEDVKEPHVLASGGFLDDTPQHRTYWTVDTDLRYGPPTGVPGPDPQGDLLAMDGDTFYEVRGYLPGRHSLKMKPRNGYTLFSGTRVLKATGPAARRGKRGMPMTGAWKERWATQIPLAGHALTVADDVVIVAGVPLKASYEDTELSDSYAGKLGGVLWTASGKDGSKIAELKLPAAPVWDGIAVASDNCLLSLKDGHILCLQGTD